MNAPLRLFFVTILAVLAACSDSAGPANPPPTAPPPPPPPPAAGYMNVQISGKVTHDSTWYSYGQFRDILYADTGELSLLGGASMDTVVARTMTLLFPGRLDVGSSPIGRYVYGQIPSQPAAFVTIDTSFYASIPGGALTVSSATYPPRPGLEFGLMQGTMSFRAVRLTAGPPGGGPVETRDTIAVSVEFNAHWAHYLRPNITVSLTGGPLVGSALVTTGQSDDDSHGGRFVSWNGDFDKLPGQGIPYEMSQEFRLAAPAVGTYPLAHLTPTQWNDATQWPAAFSAIFYRDDPRLALSAGGTLTITKYLAPTDAYYGEIQGTLDAPLALWTNDSTVSADTVHASAQFAVQLWPLGGIPASRGFAAVSAAAWQPLRER